MANFSLRSGLGGGTLEEDEVGDGSLVPLQIETLLVWELLDLTLHSHRLYDKTIMAEVTITSQ